MQYAVCGVRVDRLVASRVKCDWNLNSNSVDCNSYARVRMVDLACCDAMAQIVRQRYIVRGRTQKDDCGYDYRNQNYRDGEGG